MPRRRKSRIKRGHPIAVLIGLHEDVAVFWRIFSEIVKPDILIKRGRKRKYQDNKQLYRFHQNIVNKLRPIIKEGLRSILLVSPPKKEYSTEFMSHVKKHHKWLLKKGENTVVFTEIEGLAKTQEDVFDLVRKDYFKEAMKVTSNQEAMLILEDLYEIIGKSNENSKILYTLEEIENEIDKKWKKNEVKPNYIILTDEYLVNPQKRRRAHRILQIAKNLGIRTKVVNVESVAGMKVKSFGGLICFTKSA
jgi:stalled ribosome rescue protein Dom34